MGPQTAFSMLAGAVFGEPQELHRDTNALLTIAFHTNHLTLFPISAIAAPTLMLACRFWNLGAVCKGKGLGARAHHRLADGSLRLDPVGVPGNHGRR